jgi:predicted anti-sigma-YlaC factor YlaD
MINQPPGTKKSHFARRLHTGCLVLALGLAAGGCSIRRMAVNMVGDALAQSGSTFASDDDPELIRDAAPFSLKLMESLLAESPDHQGLLQATASGFTQYAFAFVQQEADEIESEDFQAAEEKRARARRLYQRARDYGLRGLEVKRPGFAGALRIRPAEAVRSMRKADVPLMYWTAAAWGSLISLSKDRPELIADQPVVEALIDRALELDENWDQGALHSFLIGYEFSRQGAEGDPEARARAHFQRALELSQGRQAGPLVALAEAVCIQKQQAAEFQALLERALAIDPDEHPPTRLVNLIMQRRARWLLSRMDDLFLLEAPPLETPK